MRGVASMKLRKVLRSIDILEPAMERGVQVPGLGGRDGFHVKDVEWRGFNRRRRLLHHAHHLAAVRNDCCADSWQQRAGIDSAQRLRKSLETRDGRKGLCSFRPADKPDQEFSGQQRKVDGKRFNSESLAASAASMPPSEPEFG